MCVCKFPKSIIFEEKCNIIHSMGIYNQIKERRILLGITPQALADISGVALRTIQQIETGKGNPSVNTLNKILDVLGMTLDLSIKNLDNV